MRYLLMLLPAFLMLAYYADSFISELDQDSASNLMSRSLNGEGDNEY